MFLCEHKNSEQKVAVKQINKAKIKRSFGRNGNTFMELQSMHAVCRSQVPNLIDLLDTFEDPDYYYTVTKFMPYCDLQKHLTKNINKGPMRENEAK